MSSPLAEQPTRAIFGICSSYVAMRIPVDLVHLGAFDTKVTAFPLHNAQRVNPDVPNTQLSCNTDGMLKVQRKLLNTDPFGHQLVLVRYREGEEVGVAPAMAQSDILVYLDAIPSLDDANHSFAESFHINQAFWNEGSRRALPATVGMMVFAFFEPLDYLVPSRRRICAGSERCCFLWYSKVYGAQLFFSDKTLMGC